MNETSGTLAHHRERVRHLRVENAGVEGEVVLRQEPERFEKARLEHELRIRLALDQATHAAHRLELRDPRDLRLDRCSALERQADDGAEHAAVMGSEPVHPLGFIEILRHVDIDFDEDEAFDLVWLRRIGEIVRRPVALERRRFVRPGIAEPLLIEEMDVGIDDGKIDHAKRLPLAEPS